jgi:transcriptional regulator with XRE-family HTH domain
MTSRPGAIPGHGFMKKSDPPVYRLDPAKLKARRAALSLAAGREISQREIAEKAGMQQPNYARCEAKSKSNPSFSNAMRIAKALGCLIEDLTSP